MIGAGRRRRRRHVCTGGGSAHIPTVGNRADAVSAARAASRRAPRDSDTVVYDDGSDASTAAAAARARADVAVVFGYYTEAEGSDRANLVARRRPATR